MLLQVAAGAADQVDAAEEQQLVGELLAVGVVDQPEDQEQGVEQPAREHHGTERQVEHAMAEHQEQQQPLVGHLLAVGTADVDHHHHQHAAGEEGAGEEALRQVRVALRPAEVQPGRDDDDDAQHAQREQRQVDLQRHHQQVVDGVHQLEGNGGEDHHLGAPVALHEAKAVAGEQLLQMPAETQLVVADALLAQQAPLQVLDVLFHLPRRVQRDASFLLLANAS